MSLFSNKVFKNINSNQAEIKEHTILIVDDEDHNISTLSDLLRDSYDIITARSGQEGLELIENYDNPERIHLIISDQRMPEMLGVDFLTKTIAILPKTIRMVLTGFSDIDVMIASINQANIYRFILKPFNQDDMLLTVQRALDTYQLELDKNNLLIQLKEVNLNLEKKVQQRTNELEAALTELKETNSMKDKFFSIIAHDTANLFTSLIAAAQMLEQQINILDKDTIRSLGKTINRSSNLLHRLMKNILDWAKMQMGRMDCEPENIPLIPIVSEGIDLSIENALQKNINLSHSISENLTIYADPNMVKTIVRNLLTNAIKFTEPKGKINIFSEENDQFILISVEDTGIGIPSEHLDSIFRIDFDPNSNQPNIAERGSGIGLILCKEMVEKNKGEIWVKSQKGKGTTFTFSLPKTQ